MESTNRTPMNSPTKATSPPEKPGVAGERSATGEGPGIGGQVVPEPEDLYLKRETVRAMLSHVIDPEVGLDILTMGLIYNVDVSEPGVIRVEMTLTTKGCPMSAYITAAARQALRQVYPDDEIRLQLVWDPPWTPAMINRDGLDLLRR